MNCPFNTLSPCPSTTLCTSLEVILWSHTINLHLPPLRQGGLPGRGKPPGLVPAPPGVRGPGGSHPQLLFAQLRVAIYESDPKMNHFSLRNDISIRTTQQDR
ncbi:hypothetical protein E2C01_098486 [Portunus trituberculatus]|uniref:Uncharacterized protein n=1 Tax=Portunus trituberculatus TaxID=210409 RepID=A0A5B7KD15_PORTR|nr:hypothetical protein [Portunus trituberculatus]